MSSFSNPPILAPSFYCVFEVLIRGKRTKLMPDKSRWCLDVENSQQMKIKMSLFTLAFFCPAAQMICILQKSFLKGNWNHSGLLDYSHKNTRAIHSLVFSLHRQTNKQANKQTNKEQQQQQKKQHNPNASTN